MEETLKLILEKISAIDENQKEMKQDISTMKQQISSLEKGQQEINKKLSTLEKGQQDMSKDISKISITIESTIEPKISALFEARDISLHADETIINDVKEVKEDISHLEKAIIRNTADIVDLKDYRKEN